MKEFQEKRPMDEVERINGNVFKQMGKRKKLKVASLNTHLICVLCSGYFVEATAIIECLHTFCRSCIVKYLQSNNFCPICDVQTHQTKPWSSLRPDKTLQDLVYKLVPGLYQNEMWRRRQFYSRLGGDSDLAEGEEGGNLSHGARFFSQDDSISLSLEYYSGSEQENEGDEENIQIEKFNGLKEKSRRYLQCPAAVTVRHLKKFLRMKYGIGLDCWVDIIYNNECLPENFSLIDVAYTFTWKRTSPMRFSYRIFRKAAVRAKKVQKNFQTSSMEDTEGKKSKHQSSLEQQKQNEYLGNFNLNPTNSGVCKSQNYNRNKNHCSKSINNNNTSMKNNNAVNEQTGKKNEYCIKNCREPEDVSRDKVFHSSEESNASELRIISEKEESLKENSEDSEDSVVITEISTRKPESTITNFEEEAVDSFTAKKLLKNKNKMEGKKGKRKLDSFHKEKRRKSASHAEDLLKKRCFLTKRRKTMTDDYSLKREEDVKVSDRLSTGNEEEDPEFKGNLKNEALRKVFVSKEKPEIFKKRKDGEIRRKKRKKSKHHESDVKKRKSEDIPTSPSIMSFAKDALKLKVKLTPNKPVVQALVKEDEKINNKDIEEGDSDKEEKKSKENEYKKIISDKERLLHLRAVRHKNIITNASPKDYINAPPSLTISKIDSSEQQPVKNTLVETRPSLEIMLVNLSDNSKTKKLDVSHVSTIESRKEPESKKTDNSAKEVLPVEVVDNFGVLDLSEKSTRTKENTSNSSSPKETSESSVEKSKKSTHQSILQIAQTLVSRKLSPILPENHLRAGFDSSNDSSATAAAMRNLKTLSDTAVNILMAAQSKNFSAASETQKQQSFAPPAPTLTSHKPSTFSNSTKSLKDCENGSGLKIPMYSASRERTNSIPPVPNLHEIYPRNRGKPYGKPTPPSIKPGQNQTVRQIPNPFVVLNRQGNQNHNLMKHLPPQTKLPLENGEDLYQKSKLNSIPPLHSIKTKSTLPKLENLLDSNESRTNLNDFKAMMPKIINNNTKTIQNCSESNYFGINHGEERRGCLKLSTPTPLRKVESMAKNIESVAAGLTARAVSNAMIDAK